MRNTEDLFQQALENCPEIVCWAFKNKPKNFYTINEEFDIEGSYSNLIRLLNILQLTEELRNANCSNIQEKFAETNKWSKFLSLGSELFFAYEFVKLGFEVSLISDNSREFKKTNGDNGASPDISIKKDGQQFLVEVARISDDETQLEIANKINPIIKENPFRVRIQYSEEFSTPVIGYEEREERERLIKDFVNKFREIIQTIDSNSLPHVQNILDCQVEFSESLGQHGYYAGCSTSPIFIPAEKIQLKIKNVLEEKAKKRQQWDDSQKNLPYLVALDIQQNLFFEEKLISLFSGNPRNPNFKNVTGVIARTENNRSIRPFSRAGWIEANPLKVVPNPFAQQQINCLDLEKIIPWRSVKDIYQSS
jgi:hypothetical protein